MNWQTKALGYSKKASPETMILMLDGLGAIQDIVIHIFLKIARRIAEYTTCHVSTGLCTI